MTAVLVVLAVACVAAFTVALVALFAMSVVGRFREEVAAWREGKVALAEDRARDEIAALEQLWAAS